jgi:hypothetical protein
MVASGGVSGEGCDRAYGHQTEALKTHDSVC